MNIRKRAALCTLYQRKTSITIFLIVLLLSSLVIGAFSIQSGIQNIQNKNSLTVPPFATIVNKGLDFNADEFIALHGINPFELSLTSEMVEEITQLPMVYAYEHRVGFGMYVTEWELIDYFRFYTFDNVEGNPVILNFVGVNDHLPLAFRNGHKEIVSGRAFSDEDFATDAQVIIIPEPLAVANNLSIGDIVRLDDFHIEQLIDYNSNHPIQTYEFEIIGIFSLRDLPNSRQGTNFWTSDEALLHGLARNSYIPLPTALKINDTLNDFWYEINPNNVLPAGSFDGEILFQTHDTLDLPAFIQMANEILPPFMAMRDFSYNYSDLNAVLFDIDHLAASIQIGAFSMAILILSLLIFLLDNNRRKEIGLYLAVGERKRKIFFQFLLERISLTILAIVIAFVGVKLFINEPFEDFMLREFLYTLENRKLDLGIYPLESAGFFHQVTYQDMLDAFEITLATNDIIFILLIIFLPVLIATTISLSVLTRKRIVDLIR